MGDVRAVLFDIDDTLLDYSAAERGGITDYLTELGVAAERRAAGADFWHEAQERHFGRFLAGEVDFTAQQHARAAEMIDWLGLPPLTRSTELAEWFSGYRRHHDTALRPFDDVIACLAALPADVALGVISNNDEGAARAKLTRVDLLTRFRCVVCVDTAGCAKPEPGIFRHACRLLEVEPADAVYVGDRLDSDAMAAAAAGLRGVWLDRTAGPGDREVPAGVVRITGLSGLSEALGLAAFSPATPVTGDLI
ncbi:MAG: HAD family hydrolase [Actinocatenispora sp.]